MAESVDALVSNTSGAIRAGSTPALGTEKTLVREPFFCAKNFKNVNLNEKSKISDIFLLKNLQISFFFCNFAADFFACVYAREARTKAYREQ